MGTGLMGCADLWAAFRSKIAQPDLPTEYKRKRVGRTKGKNMASREITASSAAVHNASTTDVGSYTRPLAIVTTLFFMWGFLTSLNDILVPHLKSIFDL